MERAVTDRVRRAKQTLEGRFWAKVDRSAGPDGCWPWTAARMPTGYGVIGIGHAKTVNAHRLSLMLATGVTGEFALHSCDNPPCVNPAHLSWGSRQDNVRDAVTRRRLAIGAKHGTRTQPGTVNRGESHANAKLTSEAVRDIRASGLVAELLAERHGVSPQTISRIRNRKSWKHVD
jgi:hypothetical protein